ncbi:MAG: pimA, partial [Myxococcaceae bacterium]|nr:pimA [Myxococcaceae bacterium]
MRIAHVAPLFESVPAQLYGGAERVVSYLTEELVDLGHQVTLFASGDSVTRAELVAGSSRALRLGGSVDAAECAHAAMLEQVYLRRRDFD